MAKDELQPFINLGPFLGMNTSDAQPFVPPGYAILAKNANTYRHKGALMPERGRVSLDDLGTYMAQITVITPVVENDALGGNYILVQGLTAASALVTLLLQVSTDTVTVLSNDLMYTQAVQYGSVVYTNGGQRIFLNSAGPITQLYTWQYTGFTPIVQLTTATTGGNIPTEIRSYVFTQVTAMPDGTTSETSPVDYSTPISIQTGAGDTNSITLTPATAAARGSYTITGVPTTGDTNTYTIGGNAIVTNQSTGNTQAQQATNDAAAINAYEGILVPQVTAVATGNLITITAVNPGPGGNSITTTGTSSGGDTVTANQAMLSGGSLGTTQADGSYTITGTPNSAARNQYVINGNDVVAPQVTGDTPSQQAIADAAYINSAVGSIVTASATGPNVVLTAVAVGPAGNGITTTGFATVGGDTLTPNQAALSGGAFGASWSGTNAGPNGQTLVGVDGTTYSTNIYAQSSLQAGYFLVANVSGGAPFIDTLSDAQLAENTPLLVVGGSAFQRDPPPLGPFSVPVNRIAFNLPYIMVYQNCMFVFTYINSTIVQGSSPSSQLWYSLPGKPWEFSSDTRALLLSDSVEVNTPELSSLIQDYNAPLGDYPKSLALAGSYLLCSKRREQWIVYGNGTDASPFTQQKILNIGSQSIRSATSVVGGAFFMSENGLYFFDGTSPQYDESKFRFVDTDFIDVSNNDNIHCVGAFANLTFYLFYPTLGKGYSYNTVTGEWMSELEYAPCNENAIFSVPADWAIDPTVDPTCNIINQVVAARYGLPTALDYLFADPVFDLAQTQFISWQGPENDLPGTDFKKEYTCMTIYAPIQPGIINVQVVIDGNLAVNRSFDLSAQRPLITNFSVQGYSANVLVSMQNVGDIVPEVWKVQIWGCNLPMLRLNTPQ